ncbi:ankyrin repeat domain-containing protein, partial [Nereida ignava]|uniref:ankyrin repeat domain-containing protein n=1 Tax=Nereida ignava TaxID=282199 RepID=UPI0030F7575B
VAAGAVVGGALLVATKKGSTAVVAALLVGATTRTINFRSPRTEQSPLLHAAKGGHVAILLLLLADPRIDVNMASASGRTPLMAAAKRGNETAMALLLVAGADLSASMCAGGQARTAQTFATAYHPASTFLASVATWPPVRVAAVHLDVPCHREFALRLVRQGRLARGPLHPSVRKTWLGRELLLPWTRHRHFCYPPEVRDVVATTLLVGRRTGALPAELWHLIFAFTGGL